MSNMATVVQRVRELVAARPPTAPTTPGDLANIATEIGQLTETVKQDANTQYAGQYVFSGTQTSTAPYAQGEAGRIPRQRRNDRPRDRSGRDR